MSASSLAIKRRAIEEAKEKIEQSKTKGQNDGSQGLAMDPEYVNKGDIGYSGLQKQAYVKAYVEARESRGSGRRKTKKSKKTKRKVARRKTRGRK